MSAVILVKNNQGKLEGLGERAASLWAKWKAAIEAMDIGETIAFTFKVPRSEKFHRLHFAGFIHPLFESQEQFADEYQFRKWIEVGAGHCDFVPGPKGRMVALPRSINYENLDDEEFHDVHEACKRFVRTEHCRRFLWPHLSDEQTLETVDGVMEALEK